MEDERRTRRERIIPIQIEGENDNDEKIKRKEKGKHGTSVPKERTVPVQFEEGDLEISRADINKNERANSKEVSSSNNQNEETNINHKEKDTDIPSTSAEIHPFDAQNQTNNDTTVKRSLPYCNAKEKIIIIVDSAEDDNCTPFKFNNNTLKPLDMIKRGVEMFVNHKHRINRKHEYALVVLNENNAIWLLDFTNNISDVINSLENIGNCDAEDVFNLDSLFDVILKHVDIPDVCEIEEMLIPPSYVTRSILFYARSYTVPEISNSEDVRKLLEAPYYTFDVLMTHEPIDTNNNCDKISNILQSVDKKGFAYFFPVARDAKTLYESVGKLLGHPLQRPVQKLASYSLKDYIEKYN